MYTIEKNVGVLKDGKTFGELSLIYGIIRRVSIVSVTNSCLIKINKVPFDKYVKNIFENQLQDQIEFLKLCPMFQKIDKDSLIKLGVRAEFKRFATGKGITETNRKCDIIYIILMGVVKVIENIKFIHLFK